MILGLIFSDPVMFFAWLISVVIAITIHEFSHALAATWLGDPTARNEGRVSLNPIRHMDLWGTILLVLAGFGWGKPVPFNPYNLKYPRFGPAIIAMAGPASNLLLVIVFILLLRYIYPLLGLGYQNALFRFLYVLILLNITLMVFNLIPIPPLDGSKVIMSILPDSMESVKMALEKYGFFILLALVLLGGSIFSWIIGYILNIVDNLIMV